MNIRKKLKKDRPPKNVALHGAEKEAMLEAKRERKKEALAKKQERKQDKRLRELEKLHMGRRVHGPLVSDHKRWLTGMVTDVLEDKGEILLEIKVRNGHALLIQRLAFPA